MKELNDIIRAYRASSREGIRTALATVVHVEGSSYRRPGARMLVTEEGRLTGAVSGGCLEGDALRKALLAIHEQKRRLVSYDTSDEEGMEFAAQLGCNGIIHILFEPLPFPDDENPLTWLEQAIAVREEVVLITGFSLRNRRGVQPGTMGIFGFDNRQPGPEVRWLKTVAEEVRSSRISRMIEKDGVGYFVEYVPPCIAMLVVGAGNDAQPLVRMASLLGWQITVADGRSGYVTARRFPEAVRLLCGSPEQLLEEVVTDNRTVVVLMTHNYHYDLSVLKGLTNRGCGYIGSLGPRRKLERMLEEIREETGVKPDDTRIFGPVGLDIGAETAEEIAVAVIAEIMAVFTGRPGRPLREKKSGIHETPYDSLRYVPPRASESLLCGLSNPDLLS